jgi:glycosyltransferase involved in cell wall biosynthesis
MRTASVAQGLVRLSVVVLAKNEEARIARCLESVRWAQELIVIDGMSTDRTVEICESFGARVIRHAFEGSFAQERNLGLEHATGEWALQIDADDVVTPEFRQALDRLLAGPMPHDAYKFRRKSILLGRFMRYGGWHHYLPNLVRRNRVRYVGDVHERPVVDGAIGVLDADIEHHPCEDLAAFITRHNRYTSIQAEESWREQPHPPEGWLARQLLRRPWKTFWKTYVKKQGFREGAHGLLFAVLYAWIEWLRWAKYWELAARRAPRRDGS